jgi:hypothetical protein
MAIRVFKGSLVITRKVKPKKGDLMCCFAHGVEVRDGSYFGRGHYISFHDDSPTSRLSAICIGTEKVIIFIKFSK